MKTSSPAVKISVILMVLFLLLSMLPNIQAHAETPEAATEEHAEDTDEGIIVNDINNFT